MKFPTTFAWLAGAVLTATLLLFSFTTLFSGTDGALPNPSPHPAAAPPETPFTPPATLPDTGRPTTENRIQIAFLLDTSNSMNGLIDQAKGRLWNILGEILKAEKNGEAPDIEVALYQYGNSSLLPQNGYIQQVSALTTDVDDISNKLFALRTGGGDEYCGHVIRTGTDELKWDDSDNTVKLIYIAGNESFHQGDVTAADALASARARGIVVNTIFCGDPQDRDASTWRTALTPKDGDFFSINQNEEVVFIPSPQDDRLEVLNRQLNRTYIPFGTQGIARKANQLAQDDNAGAYGKANVSSRTKFKASKKYKNVSWDLVDAAEADMARIATEKATLPDSLRRLDDEALTAKIRIISKKRTALQKEIRTLTGQRDDFVAEARRKDAAKDIGTFSGQINNSIKKRLVEKKYVVKE